VRKDALVQTNRSADIHCCSENDKRGIHRLKILFLSPAGELGGAERALLEMVASLQQEFPRCELAAIVANRGMLASELRALGVSVSYAPFPPRLASTGDAGAGGPAGHNVGRWRLLSRLACASPATAAYVRRLGRAINDIAPDVVHSNGFKMHLLGAWAASRHIPVIWHLHDFVSLRPLMPRLLSYSLNRCAAIIANSRSVAADARATLGPGPRVETIYNAVDLKSFTPEGARLDLDLLAGLPPVAAGAVRVGLVATMARWKGHEVFLQALAMLPGDYIRGYVIGGPIYSTAGSQYSVDELKRMASELGLDGRLGFTGFVRDSAAAIRSLDVVVHASVAPEPFGLAIAEALACGRAVVASRAGGASEIIHEHQDALAHQPGDAAELSSVLARLTADTDLRRTLGIAARKTAEASFTRARLAADLMHVYGGVTKSVPAGL
jgi:glycosyltransferase involved in cell wall biosynthesis